MKKKSLLLFIVLSILIVSLGTTQAAFLSVSPTGPFDAQGVPTITFDVIFNAEAGDSLSYLGWDFDMSFDSAELSNPVASNILAGIVDTTSDPINTFQISLVPTNFVSGANLLFDISFDIINPIVLQDGLADFWVISQVGVSGDGFTLPDFSIIQLPGADGADVGAPVPLPSAIFLLAPGLLALFGLRRRIAS